LWGTGTVDIDYVRNQFQSKPDDHRNEPIPQEKNDSPIIDGVPNDQNDRPIPDGVIEQPEDKHTAASESVPDKQDATSLIGTIPVKGEPEKTQNEKAVSVVSNEPIKVESGKAQEQGAASSADPKPVDIESEKSHKQDAATPVDIVSSNTTKAAEPPTGPIAGGIPIRVMFIGASMALGDPPQSAYRMQLRDWLVSLGNPVNCVGTVCFCLNPMTLSRGKGEKTEN
jgi:hypothetical protein